MQEKQENITKTIQRLNEYITIKGLSFNKLATKLGLSNSYFSKMLRNNGSIGSDIIENILREYPEINGDWLISGRGVMFHTNDYEQKKITDSPIAEEEALKITPANKSKGTPIPLVTEYAVAGFGNKDFVIAEDDVKDYYVIPKFRFNKIDFMIEIHGTSMDPNFKNGDVVACTILRNSNFMQWNRCYIIATKEQGILLKRLLPGEDTSHLVAVSDNKEFPPFKIPVDDITGIAMVAGLIRLE